jgi:hypothetical protein
VEVERVRERRARGDQVRAALDRRRARIEMRCTADMLRQIFGHATADVVVNGVDVHMALAARDVVVHAGHRRTCRLAYM